MSMVSEICDGVGKDELADLIKEMDNTELILEMLKKEDPDAISKLLEDMDIENKVIDLLKEMDVN